jgi:hypothetical protein
MSKHDVHTIKNLLLFYASMAGLTAVGLAIAHLIERI